MKHKLPPFLSVNIQITHYYNTEKGECLYNLSFRDVLIKTRPQDDPVYQFLDKKRAQGKPYYVYMTAGANKFLRIYYGRVKEYLASLPKS